MLTNTHSCSVTHGTNGHTHGLWPPFFTFGREYSTQELPELPPPSQPFLPSSHLCTHAHSMPTPLMPCTHAHTPACTPACLHAPRHSPTTSCPQSFTLAHTPSCTHSCTNACPRALPHILPPTRPSAPMSFLMLPTHTPSVIHDRPPSHRSHTRLHTLSHFTAVFFLLVSEVIT